MNYKLAIFDLDGTILDTLEDLTDGVNYALSECGYPVRTIAEVRRFVGNGDVPEYLGIDAHARAQPGKGLLRVQYHAHELDGGEYAVAGGGVFAEDYVTRLLAAQTVAAAYHGIVDVPVAHGGLFVGNALCVQRVV